MRNSNLQQTTIRFLASSLIAFLLLSITGQAQAKKIIFVITDAEGVAGVCRYTCISMSAEKAREAIRAGAVRAMKQIGQIRPYTIEGPVTIEIEYTTRNSLPIDAGLAPGAEVVDDRTIRYRGKDLLEALVRARL